MGQEKMKELIGRNFWWLTMNEDIVEFVRSCPECQKNRSLKHKPYGLLRPLDTPYVPWQSISMDFITDLPLSEECDQLWVIVDRFSKMSQFIPLRQKVKQAQHLASIFGRENWKLHGLPVEIVSDRDSRFTSKFWQSLLSTLGIRPQMSTAFYLQTDGQTERLNQTIVAFLRAFVNLPQNDRVELLLLGEFTYNNSTTSAHRMSLC
jgi:transposase InsO family protein